jgi:hypothetical protein
MLASIVQATNALKKAASRFMPGTPFRTPARRERRAESYRSAHVSVTNKPIKVCSKKMVARPFLILFRSMAAELPPGQGGWTFILF